MSYTKRFLEEVQTGLQGKGQALGGDITDDAVTVEARRIENTPSEFFPIMARVRPEAALDGITEAWVNDDCETIDVTACDLFVAIKGGAKPDVTVEHLLALLAIAQRWGEDEVQRRGDEAEAKERAELLPDTIGVGRDRLGSIRCSHDGCHVPATRAHGAGDPQFYTCGNHEADKPWESEVPA